jgi:hypothetical protein
VRRHKHDKLTRRYDLGFLPESRKMPQIARNHVVGAGSIGAFQEPIVVAIARHFKTPGRYDQVTSVSDELEQLPAQAFADFELRAGKYVGAFRQDWLGYVEARGLGNCQNKGSALQDFGLVISAALTARSDARSRYSSPCVRIPRR